MPKDCTSLQAEFLTRIVVVKERLSAKEQETTGRWMTEERLKACGEYTQHFGMQRYKTGYKRNAPNLLFVSALFELYP